MQTRINSIDAIRGFCLLNIFVNHLAVGSLQRLSPSNFGFSDSAEAFVLLAGVSSFLAYGPREGRPVFPTGALKVWSRARTLFLFYVLLASASVLILLASGPAVQSFQMRPGDMIAEHGVLTYAWHVLTMQEAVGYSMILRLYVALLVVAPAYIWLAARRFWFPLVPAALLWALAGTFGWAERGSLSGAGTSLAILPWNLVFASGIAIGAAITQRVVLPIPRAATVLAAVVVGGAAVLLVAGDLFPRVDAWIAANGSHFWGGLNKPLQSPLRLLHALSLAYLLIALRDAPFIRAIHAVRANNPLCRLGRHSLEVFTYGTIIATAGRQLMWGLVADGTLALGTPTALVAELLLVGFGFAAMLFVADRAGRPRPVAVQPAAA